MPCLPAAPAHIHKRYYIMANVSYSKRHNKFLFPALAGAIYGSPCEAKNEISNVVNYSKSLHSVWHFMFLLKTVVKRRYLMRFSTNLVPLRLELSESASLGDSYHVRRVRLNLMTLKAELLLLKNVSLKDWVILIV